MNTHWGCPLINSKAHRCTYKWQMKFSWIPIKHSSTTNSRSHRAYGRTQQGINARNCRKCSPHAVNGRLVKTISKLNHHKTYAQSNYAHTHNNKMYTPINLYYNYKRNNKQDLLRSSLPNPGILEPLILATAHGVTYKQLMYCQRVFISC